METLVKMKKKKKTESRTKWRDCGVGFGDILMVDFGPTVDFLVFEFSNSFKSRRISLIPLATASLPLVSRL